MSDAYIRVNNTKECELEFEVNIQGISTDAENAPQVRFVITKVMGGDLSFACEQRADNQLKWTVKLPPLPTLSPTENAHAFRVEVIIDGYYFEPASGNLIILKNPDVQINKNDKPKVAASFVTVQSPDAAGQADEPKEVKAEEPKEEKKEEPKEEKEEEEKVKEDVAPSVDNGSPTTSLLKPEFDPSNPKPAPATPDKPKLDLKKLFSFHSQPEPTVPEEVEGDEPEEKAPVVQEQLVVETAPTVPDTPQFNAKDVAENIIKSSLGNVQAPTQKGTLLKRSATGKVVVPGLVEEDAASVKIREDKQKKAREMLKGVLPD